MKHEIIVGTYQYYRKLYLANPDADLFERQFYFWKMLKDNLTNVLDYANNYEIMKTLNEETGIN